MSMENDWTDISISEQDLLLEEKDGYENEEFWFKK